MRLLACLPFLIFVAAACESGRGPGVGETTSAAAQPHVRPAFLRGPSGGAAIAPFVAAELKKGRAEHYGVLVYVGATWCEPCQHFHEAVTAGELDTLLDGVRLVEFDLDADRDALGKAGYSSKLIPLFALPKADGTASEQRIEGSVKGPAAVEQNLMPRLQAFLRGQAAG
jgi:thiol-disulfide isomerase/thioredoxin